MIGRVGQAVEVTTLVAQLQRLAAGFEPDAVPAADVQGTLADLGQAKRLIDGMLTLLARRAVETIADADGRTGGRRAAEALARTTGTTTGQAQRAMETSQRLTSQPDVRAAVRRGALSAQQAEAVTDAVDADPSATSDLLRSASSQSLHDLRRTCRDRKAQADPNPDRTRQRHHQNRSCTSFTESDGEWRAMLTGPADYGARFEAAVRAEHDALFTDASAAGRHEPTTAYKMDAVLALVERGAGPADDGPDREPDRRSQPGRRASSLRSGRQTKVIITVDAKALRRGATEPGETCDLAGVGRVSLSAVKRLIPDAHLAYVIRGAKDTSVAHLGRQVTAHQRTALQARGYECEVPSCRATHLLEIDHVRDWAFSKQTALDQLAWLCTHHHDQKSRGTHHLTGTPGDRTWQMTVDGSARTGTRQRAGPARRPMGHHEPIGGSRPIQSALI